MKILMIGQHVAAGGGIVEVERAMLNHFSSLGIESHFLATTPAKGKSVISFLVALLNLIYRILSNRPDLAHLHLASRGSTYRKIIICQILRLFRIPYFVHLHSGEFLDFFQRSPKLLKILITHKLKKAKKIITLSELVRTKLFLHMGILSCAVIRNGCADMRLLANGTPCTNREIVFIGRVNEKKGVGDLIKAFHIVCRSFPHAHMTIIGDGRLDDYRIQASACGILENIRFTGWLDKSSCAAELLRHQIFVLPSHYEGLPISILEAMSAGTPIISTNVGGIPEVIKHNHNGILIEPKEPSLLATEIIKLLNSPERRTSLALHARRSYDEEFTNIKMCNNILALYQKLI